MSERAEHEAADDNVNNLKAAFKSLMCLILINSAVAINRRVGKTLNSPATLG